MVCTYDQKMHCAPSRRQEEALLSGIDLASHRPLPSGECDRLPVLTRASEIPWYGESIRPLSGRDQIDF
jgi:hypothetical protein